MKNSVRANKWCQNTIVSKNMSYYLIFCGILLSFSVKLVNADSYTYENERTTVYISTGLANIKANELVYCQPINGCPVNHKLSHLIWDSRGVPMLIAGMNFSSGKSSSINIEGKFGSNGGDSVMDDFDWLYYDRDWSDWSHHEDTSLTESSVLDINVETYLFTTKETKLSILVGYRKESWAWQARGGTYIYSSFPDDFRDLSGSFTPGQLGISYEQQFTMPYFSLKFETQINKWKFNIQYDFSNFVEVKAVDNHHLRSLLFIEEYDKGSMSAYKIGFGYELFKNFDVYLRYDVQDYEEVRGNMTYIDTNTGVITGGCFNCAGATNSNKTFSVGASLVF